MARASPTDGLPFVREKLRRQGISQEASNIIMASWRPATQAVYRAAIHKWVLFCTREEINPVRATIAAVLNCLTEEFAKGNSYSSVNTLRSAISAILAPIDGTPAGSHPLIKRFMSGVFNIRPSLPRYSYTWDVNIVLRYIKSLGPNNEMSLKQLTIKLVTLVALLSGQRCQTISMLDLDHVDVTSSAVTFSVVGLTKTSKIGKRPIAVVLPKYPHEEPLCTVNALKHYLQKTRAVRGKNRNLFLSYVSPHKQVGTETISRWIKSSLSDAGIDTGRFKFHNFRAKIPVYLLNGGFLLHKNGGSVYLTTISA
jgi:integrase